jgi:hypothetical protein
VQLYQQDYHQLIEIEEAGYNSTLAPYDVCPNSNNQIGGFGSTQARKWAEIYLVEAQSRLNQYLTGFELNSTSLIAMQQLCAYEVCVHNLWKLVPLILNYCAQTVSLGFSAFCDLFTAEEWQGFEYFLGRRLGFRSCKSH